MKEHETRTADQVAIAALFEYGAMLYREWRTKLADADQRAQVDEVLERGGWIQLTVAPHRERVEVFVMRGPGDPADDRGLLLTAAERDRLTLS